MYLKQIYLQYNSRDLNKFYESYRTKLQKLNNILDFKISDKYGLFFFLSLVREYFPQFTANIRQEIRKNKAIGIITVLILLRYITNLLDESTAQTNKATSSAALVVARKATSTTTTSYRTIRVDERSYIKCIYYRKARHLEAEYYTKYLEKKAAFDKIIVEKKALKKQQALLKAVLTIYIATTPTVLALPLSVLYNFGNRAPRTFIAATIYNSTKPPLAKYDFGATVYANIADIKKA